MAASADTIARRIAQGRGLEPADLVVRDVRLLDLVTGELVDTDVAVCGDTVVGTYGRYEGLRVLDGRGRIAVPGFVDAHLHVESAMVTPLEFDRCVLPHGITTAVCDPHEIANVLGPAAYDYFLACAERTAMDLRVQLAPCVPATDLETSGASIGVADLLRHAAHPKVIGLAEFMNFPGVLARDPDCLGKLEAFAGRHIDGHAPLLRGLDLNGYAAAGILTDHEPTRADEALEKVRKGMTVLIREGTVSKDLAALATLLTIETSPFFAFCTDDCDPVYIAERGHIDGTVRMAIALGVPPLAAYRSASLTAARAFGLRDRGMVAPGYRADVVLIDALESCAVSDVVSAGRVVDEALFASRGAVPPVGLDSMRARPVTAADFAVRGDGRGRPVIGVVPGGLITEHLVLDLPAEGGGVRPDPARDVAKVAVVERHGKNGNVACGFVRGFGLKRGAVASSVGHDSHNICAVGCDDADIAAAVNHLGRIGGGFAVVEGGAVLADLPLPVAGLMSDRPYEAVRAALPPLRAAARGLGTTLEEPFMQMAFLPLPVIPHLKISDRGMVDVDRMALIG